jgi:hypothetical protein
MQHPPFITTKFLIMKISTRLQKLLLPALLLGSLVCGAQHAATKLPPALRAAVKQHTQKETTDPALQKKAEKLLHNFESNIRFEPCANTKGINYTTTGSGYTAGFATGSIWYNQQGAYDSSTKKQMGYAWQVSFAGAAKKDITPEAAKPLAYPVHNYRHGITKEDKAYKEMWYRNVYPGTDCRFYGNANGELEYDFILQPGADVQYIALAYNGLQNLRLESDNTISFYTTAGKQQHGKPYAYQLINGREQQVAVSYTLNEQQELGFAVTGNYDKTKALVIDPVVLVYGTYIGGGHSFSGRSSIQTDAAGTIYIVTTTTGSGIVTTPGAYDAAYTNTTGTVAADLEISAFSITGTPLFITYLGGGKDEGVLGVKLHAGDLYIAGFTVSADFPTTTGAYTLTGPDDYFIARFNATTGAANFVTVLPGGTARSDKLDIPMAFNTAGDLYLYLGQLNPTGSGFDVSHGEIYKLSGATNAPLPGFGPLVVAPTAFTINNSYLKPQGLAVNSADILYSYGTTDMDGLATTAGAILSANTTGGLLSYYEIYTGATGAKLYSSYYGGDEPNELLSSVPNTILSNGQVVVADYGLSQQTTDGSSASSISENTALLSFNAAGNTLLWAKSIGTTIGDEPLPVFTIGNDFITGTYVNDEHANSNNATGTAGALLITRPNTGIVNNNDAYLFRMDAAGNKVWATYYGYRGTHTYIDNRSMTVSGNEIAFAGSGDGPLTPDAAYNYGHGPLAQSYLAIFNINTGALVYATNLPFDISGGKRTTISFDANRILVMGERSSSSVITADALQPTGGGGAFLVINRCTGQTKYLTNLGGGNSISVEKPANETSTAMRLIGNKAIMGYLSNAANDPITTGGYQRTTPSAAKVPVVKIFDLEYVNPTANTTMPSVLTACQLGVVGTITGNEVKNQGMADLSISNITQPQNPYIFGYQWQSAPSAAGPWTDIAGGISKDYTPSPTNVNTWYRRNAIDRTGCTPVVVSTSGITALTINGNAAPTAAAGISTYICTGTGAALSGSATGGTGPYTYEWYEGGAITPNATTAVYNSSPLTQTTVFTVKATDALGCADLDQVTINILTPFAGTDAPYCMGAPGIQIGMSPYAGSGATYSWSPAAGLSSATFSNPVATPAVPTTYTLSIFPPGSAIACAATSSVTITPVAGPSANFAGADQTVCNGTNPVIGLAPEAGFNYTWSPGSYLVDNSQSSTTVQYGSGGLPSCPTAFVLTATKGGCSFYDTAKVSVINQDAGADNCSYNFFGGTGSSCTATYSWVQTGGAGVGTIISGGSSASAYLKTNGGDAVFTRTTTVNGVSCSDDVMVLDICPVGGGGGSCPNITVTSKQKCAKVFAGLNLELTYALSPSLYNIVWSSPAGAIFDNPNSNVVHISATTTTTVTVTATDINDPTHICTETININAPASTLPTVAAADVSGCANTALQIGMANVGGYGYLWTPATGLDFTNISNPIATVPATTSFAVQVSDNATGCTAYDTSTVTIAAVATDAGPDRDVCQSGIITLGSAAVAGQTYSWSPAGAAYQNGTDATFAQPQVLIAGAPGSSQTFILTVTGPTGCIKKDTVVLTVAANADSYLGTGGTVCSGGTVVLGIPAVPGATYAWSPAAGLSCTNCAQPVASPTATTAYSLSVSFNGCTLNSVATVDVNINRAVLPALPDIATCPGVATPIGFNPAPTTGYDGTISFWSWSPSDYLDDPSIDNPSTSAPVTTTYTVTAFFSTGCSASTSLTVTPNITVGAGQDRNVCVNVTTTIGSAANNVAVTWSPATDLSCTTCAMPTVSPTASSPASTVYTATYISGGCTVTDQVTVNVITPSPIMVSGNTSVCGSACTIITAQAQSGSTYQWAPTTGVQNPTSAGTKICPGGVSRTYRLYQLDGLTGCTSFTDVPITVNPSSAPAVSGSDVVMCPGGSKTLTINVTPAGSYTYSWTPAASLSNPYISNPVASPAATTIYTVTVTNAAGCENVAQVKVTVDNTGCIVVPVKFAAFTGRIIKCAGILTWTTATEEGIAYYSVEYSTDGSRYAEAARIPARNSSNGSSYGFTYNAMAKGNNFFRIKAVSPDGSAAYSSVVLLKSDCEGSSITLAPNPARDVVRISGMTGRNTIFLYDMTGKLLMQSPTGTATQLINVAGYAAGTYIVRIINENGESTGLKLVKEK